MQDSKKERNDFGAARGGASGPGAGTGAGAGGFADTHRGTYPGAGARPAYLPPDGLDAVRTYLESYRRCLSMVRLNRVLGAETEDGGLAGAGEDAVDMAVGTSDLLGYGPRASISPLVVVPWGDESFWRARMYEVRVAITSLRDGREREFLLYHYLRGASVEKCAELMGISPRTAFRLKKRALENFRTECAEYLEA